MITKFQKNTKTLGLALCLGLISSSALVGQSFAAVPELSFYPAAGWNVAAFDNGDGPKSCSVTNEFNNGYIIQITGSDRGVSDFSVDFRQSVFKKNQSYDVAVSIPDQIDITAVGVGYNEQVLGVNLVGREGLINAMGKAEIVDFFVEGNAFRFHMTGFANAVERFETCVSGYTAPVIADIPVVEPVALVAAVPEVPIIETVSAVADPVVAPQVPTPERDLPFEAIYVDDAPTSLTNVAVPEKTVYTARLPQVSAYENNIRDEPDPNLAAEQDIQSYFVSAEPVIEKVQDSEFTAKTTTKIHARMEADFSNIDSPVLGSYVPDVVPVAPVERAVVLAVPAVPPAPVYKEKLPDQPVVASLDGDIDLPQMEQYQSASPAPIYSPVVEERIAAPSPIYNDRADGDLVALEKQVRFLSTEKKALERDLQAMMDHSSEKRMDISSGNWNLEHATMKFQEAERQVERLSRQIQRERASHEQESAKLEAMLFDPEVTKTEQLARLSDLERQLDDKNAKSADQQRKYEMRIQLLEKQLERQ